MLLLGPYHFCPLSCPFLHEMFPWYFLKRSLVFPILLFSSISLHCLFKKAFLSLLAILWNSAFTWVYLSFSPLLLASFLSSAIYKASSGNHFAFLHFFSLEMVLVTISCAVLSCSIVSNSLRCYGLYPPGYSVLGTLQARILEWVAISYSSRSFQPRDRSWVS